MTDPGISLYAFVYGAMLVLSALGLESAVAAPSLDRWDKRFFTAFFAVLTASSLAFFPELVAYAHPAPTSLYMAVYYIQSVLDATLFPMLAAYLLHCCGEGWRRAPLFRAMIALWAVGVVIMSAAQFSPSVYSVAPDGQTVLGPVYPLLIAPLIAMPLAIIGGAVRRRNELGRRRCRAFLICLAPVAVAMVVHAIVPIFTLINAALTVSAFAMYRIIESDSAERGMRQQQQIASQRASIAVLQMRPHFIYNAMTSIYYLCDQDPERAKRATRDFTAYLRKSFTAIASDGAIPFPEELEHTHAYLAVEQAQFEDDLVVVYDTPHTRFRIPPLTLQPLVENAVKHGMDPDSAPLHVWVRTRETGSGSEVVVEDDGPGFDAALADEPRTTLANIRQRLDMMCGGALDIEPREGGGTKVTVTVPQGQDKGAREDKGAGHLSGFGTGSSFP